MIEADTRPEAAVLPFASGAGWHLLVADSATIYDCDEATARAVQAAITMDDREMLPATMLPMLMRTPDRLQGRPMLTALSLNLAQLCNMGCGYCYAGQGKFGGAAATMSEAVAKKSVDLLIGEAPPGASLAIAFMGGEPLRAFALLRRTGHAPVNWRGNCSTDGLFCELCGAEFVERGWRRTAWWQLSIYLAMSRSASTRVKKVVRQTGSDFNVLKNVSTIALA